MGRPRKQTKKQQQEIEGGNIFKKISRGVRKTVSNVSSAVNNTIDDTRRAVINFGDDVKDTYYDTRNRILTTANNIINTANTLYDKIERIIDNVNFSPAVENFIQMNGNKQIVKITANRSRVPFPIQKLMYSLTENPDAQEKTLYHLFLVLQFSDGSKCVMEKNDRVNISNNILPAESSLDIPLSSPNLTLNLLISNAQQLMGQKLFFSYNSSSNNCQVFVGKVLEASKMLTSDIYNFVKQDTTDLFQNSEGLRKLSNTIVRIGNVASHLLSGGELETKSKRGRKPKGLTKAQMKKLEREYMIGQGLVPNNINKVVKSTVRRVNKESKTTEGEGIGRFMKHTFSTKNMKQVGKDVLSGATGAVIGSTIGLATGNPIAGAAGSALIMDQTGLNKKIQGLGLKPKGFDNDTIFLNNRHTPRHIKNNIEQRFGTGFGGSFRTTGEHTGGSFRTTGGSFMP